LLIFSGLIFIALFVVPKNIQAACTGNTKCAPYSGGHCWWVENMYYTVGCTASPQCEGNPCNKAICLVSDTCEYVCNPGATTCGPCSKPCGGGTSVCTNGCSSWNVACHTQACPPGCTPNCSGMECGPDPVCSVSCGTCTAPETCNASGQCVAPPPPPPSSCTVDLLPATATTSVGSSVTLTASVTVGSGTVDQVNFTSANTGILTVSPASDSTVTYQTQATGVALGSTTVSTEVIMGGVSTCADSAGLGGGTVVDVTSAGPWWQVIDADVTTNGNLTSTIPGSCSLPSCNPLFDLVGPGGYPGIPAYGGAVSFGNGTVSTLEWLANTLSQTSNNRQYTYAWFKRLIPSDVTINEITSPSIDGTELSSGGTASGGYYYYHYDGSSGLDLTINTDASLGTRRVILLVDGADLNLNARINFTKGQGFFMAIVGKTLLGAKGNINVSSTLGGGAIPHLEGLFEADNAFHSGAGTTQLYIRGSVAAYGGINLERDLTDNSATPAEVFEYAPDLVFTYPYKLRERRIFWQEVAP